MKEMFYSSDAKMNAYLRLMAKAALLLLAGLVLLAFCGMAMGQSCATVSHANTYTPTVKHEVAVVKKEIVTPVYNKFVAVIPLVEFPTYSAVYVPTPVYAPATYTPQAPAYTPGLPAPQMQAETRQILELLKSMDRRIQSLESIQQKVSPSPTAPSVPAQPGKDPFNPGRAGAAITQTQSGALAVLQAKCSQCHSKGKEEAGGDFILLGSDGTRSPLSAKGFREMARRINNGSMPPKNNKLGIAPLSDEEASLLVDDLRNYPEGS